MIKRHNDFAVVCSTTMKMITVFCALLFVLQFEVQAQLANPICKQTCVDAQGTITFTRADGTCPSTPQEIYSCAPFACDDAGKTCRLDCADNRYCAKGFICDPKNNKCVRLAYTCTDDVTIASSLGGQISCQPYRCKMGSCLRSCQNDDECAPGHRCELNKHYCTP